MELNLQQLEVLNLAVLEYTSDKQTEMVIEECSELILAIQKHKRNPDGLTVTNMIDEAADVFIMVNQLALILDFEAVNQRVAFKINRLKERLNK